MRQNKYLNNIVEQDYWAIKRIIRAKLGFKSFWRARIIIAGIETMHMIRKGQLDCPAGSTASAAAQFYGLAFRSDEGQPASSPSPVLMSTDILSMCLSRFGGAQANAPPSMARMAPVV